MSSVDERAAHLARIPPEQQALAAYVLFEAAHTDNNVKLIGLAITQQTQDIADLSLRLATHGAAIAQAQRHMQDVARQIDQLLSRFDALERRLGVLERGDLAARVARLEEQVARLRADMALLLEDPTGERDDG